MLCRALAEANHLEQILMCLAEQGPRARVLTTIEKVGTEEHQTDQVQGE